LENKLNTFERWFLVVPGVLAVPMFGVLVYQGFIGGGGFSFPRSFFVVLGGGYLFAVLELFGVFFCYKLKENDVSLRDVPRKLGYNGIVGFYTGIIGGFLVLLLVRYLR